MIQRITWVGLLALMLANTAHATSGEGGTRPSSTIYKHVHKPSNIRMPWMVPAGTVTARPDGQSAQAEKTTNKQKQP